MKYNSKKIIHFFLNERMLYVFIFEDYTIKKMSKQIVDMWISGLIEDLFEL